MVASAIELVHDTDYVAIRQGNEPLKFNFLAQQWSYAPLHYDARSQSAEIVLIRLQYKPSRWKKFKYWFGSADRQIKVHRLLDNAAAPEIDLIAKAPFGGGRVNRLPVTAKGPIHSVAVYRTRLRGGKKDEFVRESNLEDIGRSIYDETKMELVVTIIRFPFGMRVKPDREPLVPKSMRPLGFRIQLEKGISFDSAFQRVAFSPNDLVDLDIERAPHIQPTPDSPYTFSNDQQRPVFLSIYHGLSAFYHEEVHVGGTAFTLGINPKTHAQMILYRPVSMSYYYNEEPLKKEIFMCLTQKSDNDILSIIEKNWKGTYCALDKSCQEFARELVMLLCPRMENKIPAIPIKAVGRTAKNVLPKAMIPRTLEKYMYPQWSDKDWPIREHPTRANPATEQGETIVNDGFDIE